MGAPSHQVRSWGLCLPLPVPPLSPSFISPPVEHPDCLLLLTFCPHAAFPSLILFSHLLQVIFLNQKRAPALNLSAAPLWMNPSLVRHSQHVSSGPHQPHAPCRLDAHHFQPQLPAILPPHHAVSQPSLAPAAPLAEMPSSTHVTCKAQSRCFSPRPPFTSQEELVHFSYRTFILPFLSSPQW